MRTRWSLPLGIECCLPHGGSASVLGGRKVPAPSQSLVAHHGHLSGDVTCWRAEVPSAIAKLHTSSPTLNLSFLVQSYLLRNNTCKLAQGTFSLSDVLWQVGGMQRIIVNFRVTGHTVAVAFGEETGNIPESSALSDLAMDRTPAVCLQGQVQTLGTALQLLSGHS